MAEKAHRERLLRYLESEESASAGIGKVEPRGEMKRLRGDGVQKLILPRFLFCTWVATVNELSS